MKHAELTDKIIKAFYKVYNAPGYGFLEKVYENALYVELMEMDFTVQKQKKHLVYYNGHVVGDYCSDLLVNDLIVIEIKANEYIIEANENQLINYLKATSLEVGLLLNFGKKPAIKRKIFDNDKKTMLPGP